MRRLLLVLGGCLWALSALAQSRPIGVAATAALQSVTLAWDANQASDMVQGYKLSYGTTSGTYAITVDVGNVLTWQIAGLQSATRYFFVAQAYSQFGLSGYSNEVTTVTTGDPCAFPLGSSVIQVFPTQLSYTGSGGAGSKARLDFQVASQSPVTAVSVISNGAVLQAMSGMDLTALAGMWFQIPVASGSYPLSIGVQNLANCPRVQSTSFTVHVP